MLYSALLGGVSAGLVTLEADRVLLELVTVPGALVATMAMAEMVYLARVLPAVAAKLELRGPARLESRP